jgi:phosphoribosylformylglycinamidine cyclo-ligase
VTGGGLAANLARVLPVEVRATIDRSTWTPAPVFDLVRRVGDVPQDDLELTLNCGVGMVALVSPDDAERAVEVLAEHDVRAWAAGEVTTADSVGGTVELVGQHPGW